MQCTDTGETKIPLIMVICLTMLKLVWNYQWRLTMLLHNREL